MTETVENIQVYKIFKISPESFWETAYRARLKKRPPTETAISQKIAGYFITKFCTVILNG